MHISPKLGRQGTHLGRVLDYSVCGSLEAWLDPAPFWFSQAYLRWLAEGGKDQRLPGLNLTYAQLFFINYAQVTPSRN